MLDRNKVTASDLRLLSEGKVPNQPELLREMTTGLEPLTDFLAEQYLDFYVKEGGSKVKFLTGRAGTGKTHLSRLLLNKASEKGYIPVFFSAENIWLHDFSQIYLEILRQCDLENILTCAAQVIAADLGYDARMIQNGKRLMDALSEQGDADALVRGEIRTELRNRFTRNPLLDNTFASCCSLLIGDLLGHPVLEDTSRKLLLAHMHGDKSVKLTQLRALGLSPSRINKFNARHLLRSLSELVHLAGYCGIMVIVDDVEVLLRRSSESGIRYTKMRREDSYESIRQLIDDIDTIRYTFFVFSFHRELMDNESYGFKSYQALWFRIQSEVISSRFNRFADIIDLDRYADEFYTPDVLVEMSGKFAGILAGDGATLLPITSEKASELIERSRFGGIGLPYLLIHEMIEGDEIDG